MPNATIPKGLKTTRKHDVILITVPNYWAKGFTLDQAVYSLKKMVKKIDKYWRVYSVHPNTTVNEMGQLEFPSEHRPITVAECNPDPGQPAKIVIYVNESKIEG